MSIKEKTRIGDFLYNHNCRYEWERYEIVKESPKFWFIRHPNNKNWVVKVHKDTLIEWRGDFNLHPEKYRTEKEGILSLYNGSHPQRK